MRIIRPLCAAILIVVPTGFGCRVLAQQAQGSFTGVVTDPTGAVVPGAVVTVTEQGTGFARRTVSTNDGVYTLPLLPPGRYVITAEKPGFRTFQEGFIPLTVDQHAKVDIRLEIGSAATTVNVEAAPPVLDTQNYSIGTTVEQAKISQLPFNGRHFLEATLFTPGVVPGSQGSELNDNRGGSINVNGMRESMNVFLLDGMSDTSIAVGTYSATPPLDSIQEFRMETGVYDAKFGNQAGAQINMVTKSGTNQFHGTFYEYFRNSRLDARNFFEPFVPPFHRNQFGTSVGGPIVLPHVYDGHDQTFFFLNYEGLRDLHSFFTKAHVPDLAERAGDLSELLPGGTCPSNTVLLDPLALFSPQAPLTVPNNNVQLLAPAFPSGTVDPVGQALINLYPAPNIPGAACGQENYTAVVRRKVYTNDYVGRFDHRWGSRDSVFFRYNLTTDAEQTPSGVPTGLPGFGTWRDDWFTATGLDWTHTFSPTLLNEAKVDYNRWQYDWFNQDRGRGFVGASLGIKNLPSAGRDAGVPVLSFSPFDGLGNGGSVPQAGAVNTFEYAEDLTQIHGTHTLDYGLQIHSIRRGNFYEDIAAHGQFNFSGVVTGGALFSQLPGSAQQQLLQLCPPSHCGFGNGVADALFGIPTSWVDGFSGYISGAGSEYDFFAQDNWKVRSSLTVTFGLRYEYNTPVSDKFDHLGGFDFSTDVCGSPGAIMVAGRSAVSLDCFVGTINNAAGLPEGRFVPKGSINLGSTSANRGLQRADTNNWGPRIGLAWQPFGDRKTVIRTGFGTYYDQMTGELYFQKSFNPPFFQLSAGNLQDNQQAVFGALATPPAQGGLPLGTGLLIQNVFASPLLASALFPTLNPVIVNLEDSTVYEWSFDVQRDLGRAWLLDTGYVGTRGLHLPFMWDPNQPDNSNPALCTPGCPRLYPNFLTQSYTDSSGKSIYHALEVKLERHYASGLALIGGYTYAKSLDTNSTYFGTDGSPNFPENSYNRAAEKGRSDFDHRQRLTVAYVYDFPFGSKVARLQNPRLNYLIEGWELSGIAMAQSGAPYTVSVSGNPSHNVDGNDRPNVVVGMPVYPRHQTVNQWALASAFSVPAQFTYGNAGRDTLTGPGEAAWDFSLIRKFRLTESKQLEFRAEMFNIFNQPNFALPNSNILDPNFGKINNTVQPIAGQASGGPGDPRQIQFALRLLW